MKFGAVLEDFFKNLSNQNEEGKIEFGSGAEISKEKKTAYNDYVKKSKSYQGRIYEYQVGLNFIRYSIITCL